MTKLLTNEQTGDVNKVLEEVGESVTTAIDILQHSQDSGMVLNELHDAQDKINRLVTRLEDIVNG